MPIDHVARVVIQGELHGQQTINVLHFGSEGAVPPDVTTNLQNLIAAVLTCIRDTLLPAVSQDWKLQQVTAKQLYPTATDERVVLAEPTDVGAIAGDGDVSFTAQLLQIRTGLAGRTNRGRMFIAGVPEGGVSQSRLTPGQLALIAAFAACLVSEFIGQPAPAWNLGILSRKNLQQNYSNAHTNFRLATSVQATNLVATMRSRKVGKGR